MLTPYTACQKREARQKSDPLSYRKILEDLNMKINIKEIFDEQEEKNVESDIEADGIQEPDKADEAEKQNTAEEEQEKTEAVSEEEPEPEAEEAPESVSEEEPEPETEEVPEAVSEEELEESQEPEETQEDIVAETEEDVSADEEESEKQEGEESASAEKRISREALKKYGWPGGIAVSFAILLFSVFAYTSMVPREVNATINGEKTTVMSREHTIEDFLETENIKYCKADYISKSPETFIYDGISFDLRHATDYTVTADGKTAEYKTLKRTVGGALAEEGIKVGDLDIVTPSMDSKMGDNMNIVIQRVTVKEEVKEEPVAFKTVEKDDSSLNEGTSKVVTEGKNGIDKVTYQITYVDGVESSRKEVGRETVTAAVDKVVANGTRINFNGTSYSRKLVVKAYAYTGGGITAMGTRARVGEIAVDPSVIPLGSTVYIEGVGARRAEDTGGNIKGNTIDIYMNTESQCRSWGVRYVTVYIK